MVLGTFTPEVATSFEYLRHAVEDIQDETVRSTITAVVDGLVSNIENQMLLVFANCSVQEHEREQLLLKQRQDVNLLDYYVESVRRMEEHGLSELGKSHATFSEGKDAKIISKNHTSSVDDTTLRQLAPDSEVSKMLMATMHCITQALAHNTHAERAVLHLGHKSTGSLRAICSIPDYTIAFRGLTTPNHQGVIGNSFTTGLAVRVDDIDAEKRKTMYTNSHDIHSVMVFPILEPIRNLPIGVVELINKAQGAPWTAMDEAHAAHCALVLQYFLHTFGAHLDLLAAPVYNATQLNLVHGYHPGHLPNDLARLPGGASGAFTKTQLVARIARAEQFPARPRHAQSLYQVEILANVRELSEYLELMDFNMRSNINELVALKQREVELKDTIQKLNIRVKVQEENAQHLQDQLNDAKRVILAQKVSAGETTGRLDGMGTYRAGMTTRQSLTQRSLQKVPLTAHSKSGDGGKGASTISAAESSGPLPPMREPVRPSTLHDFLATATAELQKLQRKALGNSTAMQRHRMFLTPEPTKSQFGK
jgi:hypothetical protein